MRVLMQAVSYLWVRLSGVRSYNVKNNAIQFWLKDVYSIGKYIRYVLPHQISFVHERPKMSSV